MQKKIKIKSNLKLKTKKIDVKFFTGHLIICFIIGCLSINLCAYQITNTTRAGALSAFTGLADDVSAILYNPAGLSTMDNHEIYLYSADIYGLDIKHQQILYALPIYNYTTLGLAIANIGHKNYDLSVSENQYNIAFSTNINKNLFTGLGVKIFKTEAEYANIQKISATATTLDFSGLYKISDWRLGFLLANINNPKFKYNDNVKSLAERRYLKFGVSYNFANLITTLDYHTQKRFSFGAEWQAVNNLFFLRGGITKQFSPTADLQYSLGFRLQMNNLYLDYGADLHNELSTTHKFAIGYKFGFKNYIDLLDIKQINLFPALKEFYKTDNRHQIKLKLKNRSNENSEITLKLKNSEFLKIPTKKNLTLPANQITEITLPLEFNEKFVNNKNEQIIYFDCNINYWVNNRQFSQTLILPARLYNYNTFYWDELDKFGLFVTPKSQVITKYNERLFKQINFIELTQNKNISNNYLQLLILHASLKSLDFKYFNDIIYPFKENYQLIAEDIKYPAQTLIDKKGDCDDMTALWSALALNRGINVAIAILPKHILPLFEIDNKILIEGHILNDYLITINEKTYLPFETTELSNSFITCCAAGFKQLQSAKNYNILTIEQLWKKYQPQMIDETNLNPDVPFYNEFKNILTQNLNEYFNFASVNNTNIPEQIANLIAADTINLSEFSELKTIAKQYISSNDYSNALKIYQKLIYSNLSDEDIYNNAANIAYLFGDYKLAITYFSKAAELSNNNPFYFAQLTLLYWLIDDKNTAAEYYERVIKLSPDYFEEHYLKNYFEK